MAPHLTQSNGGVIGFDQAARLPVRTVLSGPSTGVVGAGETGRLAGFPDMITFDMGGTSTDVALLDRGECRLSGEAVVHGYPIKSPMLDIHTVGAGGGSIAFVDGGLLKVGPRSAGAHPGPVCYGFGSTEPTVTDANLLLGYLNPEYLLGGRMQVHRAPAQAAVEALALRLGLVPMAAALGIRAVVTANMVKAIRVISVQRGYDPRDYTLIAFGGAGPLHAAQLAGELDIARVLVPRNPGVLCAMGLLLTDLRADFAMTRLLVLNPAALPMMSDAFAGLSSQAEAWFGAEGIAQADRSLVRTVDMRYAGQNYELSVPFSESIEALADGFAAAHQRLYGFIAEGDPVQAVTFRIQAMGRVPKASFSALPLTGSHPTPSGQRMVWQTGFTACPVYDRDSLRAGDTFAGPAIVEQMDTTTLVPIGWKARVDEWLNIIMEPS